MAGRKKQSQTTGAGKRERLQPPPGVQPTGRRTPGARRPPTVADSNDEYPADGPAQGFMSLGEHLEELRIRILAIIVVVALAAIAAGVMIYPLHDLIVAPYVAVVKSAFPAGVNLLLRKVTGSFVVLVKLAVMTGVLGTLPIAISILWGFATPAVSRRTAIFGHLVVGASSVLFWSGVYVCWRFLFPLALKFMLIEMRPSHVIPQVSLEEYYSFVFMMHIGAGLGFQLPLVNVVLGAMGLVTTRWHKSSWKYAVTGIFIFSALATPPDWITQIIMAGFLVTLYALSILLVWLIERARGRRDIQE